MRKALVILSGGQDSTTCLFWAKQVFDEVHALTFDYGQRHIVELDAAVKVAQMASVASHEIVCVPQVLTGRSFLTDKAAAVEEFNDFAAMEHHNAFKENKLDSSFVPMRNPLFLTIATNRAYVLGCDTMLTGVTAADYAEYGGFSWSWLGGFIDAEGNFSEMNGESKTLRLSISQKDPELLERLGKWVKDQLPGVSYSTHTNEAGHSKLYFGVKSLRLMAPLLSPHLHSQHRRDQAASKGEGLVLFEEAPLNYAYVTGFWEGDGSYFAQWVKTRVGRKSGKDKKTRAANFQFFQKDPEVLEKIKDFIGRGTIGQRKTQNCIWGLKIGDGPLSRKLLNKLLPHLNVLGSFEKVTKWLHAVDLPAGGFNPPYPDCTPDFIQSQQAVVNESLRVPGITPPKIVTPLMFLTKAQSVILAKSLPGCWEALSYSHTSYDGKYPPTGLNHANLLRAYGFEVAGLPDPLVVRAFREGLMDLPDTPNYRNLQLELFEGA